MFKLLGVVVGIYTVYAALQGEVYAKHRAWGRTIRKDDEPKYFWAVIVIYAGLSIALLTIF